MSFLSIALFVIAVLPMGVVAIDMFIIVMNAVADDDEETKPRQSGRGLLRTKRGLWWLGLACVSGLVLGSSSLIGCTELCGGDFGVGFVVGLAGVFILGPVAGLFLWLVFAAIALIFLILFRRGD